MYPNIDPQEVSTNMSDNQSITPSNNTGERITRDLRWGIICDLLLDSYRLDIHMLTGAMVAANREKVRDE